MNTELIAQLDAEIKALEEKKAVALAVEAGAEWEVDGGGTGTDWHEPDNEFAWYFREDRACAWQVRLKPKPVTRDWNKPEDVPLNCYIGGPTYYRSVTRVDSCGVALDGGTHLGWSDLAGRNYTTPELKGEWKPCETEEAK